MPIYEFENTKTGEIFTEMMSIADMEKYVKKNKHIKQTIGNMTLADPVRIGVTKPPSDFQKYVLGRIKEKNPGATAVASRRWHIPKEL